MFEIKSAQPFAVIAILLTSNYLTIDKFNIKFFAMHMHFFNFGKN